MWNYNQSYNRLTTMDICGLEHMQLYRTITARKRRKHENTFLDIVPYDHCTMIHMHDSYMQHCTREIHCEVENRYTSNLLNHTKLNNTTIPFYSRMENCEVVKQTECPFSSLRFHRVNFQSYSKTVLGKKDVKEEKS